MRREGGGDPYIELRSDEELNGDRMRIKTIDNVGFAVTDSLDNPRLVVTGAGNVGVGTTSPAAKLHISGAAGVDGLMFPDGTLQTTAGSTADGHSLDAADGDPVDAVFVDNNGNVNLTGRLRADGELIAEDGVKFEDAVSGTDLASLTRNADGHGQLVTFANGISVASAVIGTDTEANGAGGLALLSFDNALGPAVKLNSVSNAGRVTLARSTGPFTIDETLVLYANAPEPSSPLSLTNSGGLDILGPAGTPTVTIRGNDGQASSGMDFLNSDGVPTVTIRSGNTTGDDGTITTQDLHVSGSTQLDGSVGIGTQNPLRKLHVVGGARIEGTTTIVRTGASKGIDITGTGSGAFIDASAPDGTKFVVNADGSIESSTQTWVTVSWPGAFVKDGGAQVDETFGALRIWEPGATSIARAARVFFPVPLPAVLYGKPVEVAAVQVWVTMEAGTSITRGSAVAAGAEEFTVASGGAVVSSTGAWAYYNLPIDNPPAMLSEHTMLYVDIRFGWPAGIPLGLGGIGVSFQGVRVLLRHRLWCFLHGREDRTTPLQSIAI